MREISLILVIVVYACVFVCNIALLLIIAYFFQTSVVNCPVS